MKKLSLLAITLLTTTISIAQNSLNFDGVNDYVQTSFEGVLGSDNRTFEAWVYVSADAPASNLSIVDYGLNAVGSRNTFMVNGSRGLSFISGGVDANIGTVSDVVPEAVWTHVAFVLNDGTGFLYVNGVEYGTGPLTTVDTPPGGTDVRFGQRVPGGSIIFDGSIDEVRIWNYARTIDEINETMNSEFCTLPDGLVAYYKMNQGIAGGSNPDEIIAYDLAGGIYDGDLLNFGLSGDVSNWVTGADLEVGSVSSSFDAIGCDGTYTVPSGDMTYDTPGIYTDIIPSGLGCDSVMTINVSFAESTEATVDTTICSGEFYINPSGDTAYDDTGVYEDILTNAAGCDSIITINLTVLTVETFAVEAAVCDSYTSPLGTVYTESGAYIEILTYEAGCDSVVYSMDIEIFESTDTSIAITSCGDYTAPSGDIYSESSVFTDIIENEAGCDSVIVINLTVIPFDLDVTVTEPELMSNATGVAYQWVDCDADYATIDGATEQTFTAEVNGNYAVIITSGECTDTSECYSIATVGIGENGFSTNFTSYPNPSSGLVTLEFGQLYSEGSIAISTADGKLIDVINFNSQERLTIELPQPTGVYFITVNADNTIGTIRILKE